MLSCEDQAELAAALCATAETLGHAISAGAAELMAEDLADYQMEDIAAALRACRRELTGKLTLAAILQRVQAADGRPEPNEAWSLALAASDEFDSVVLTDEIQLALGAARAVLEAGDKVGARMSFLSAYQRQVDTARREGKPVCWKLSPGYDTQRRLLAVEEAGRLGRLPAPVVEEYRAQLTHEPVTQNGAAIAGLITGRVAMPSPDVRAKLKLVKASVEESQAAKERERQAAIRARQEEFERRRTEQLAALKSLEVTP
ncbi:hypothetical protein MCB86_08950 [Pseudomonas sp. KSR10]|uniref:hypothetical protein n=1 Tax=Pseudomonas sp. KSR10 TaxID=2916654 RepID=UPI001EF8EEFF|nr:hypothetical protein [Pseudomonas sp. KSR10]MCG6540201.1 hypothetical protein [Pseudomonas sp. KSR10]